MKFNKWTLGLAALGVVSLASAVKADESPAKIFVETAASGTQISGYVGVGGQWNFNNNYSSQYNYYSYAGNKHDNFSLDAVSVSISKPLDETDWAAGYNFQLVYGQDANTVGVNLSDSYYSYYYGSGASATIKNAYVELRAPVGNGIDIKVGVWDTILGYESFDRGNNPNYTYSFGYNMEPTTYTGILASYKFCDAVSASAGIANVPGSGYYGYGSPLSSSGTDSRKTYLGSVALTAPQSWGVLAGSTLYGAVAFGGYSNPYSYSTSSIEYTKDVVNYYFGTVINTGVKGLKVGASYDYTGSEYATAYSGGFAENSWANALALYSSFQATDKLSIHGRAEYAWSKNSSTPYSNIGDGCAEAYAFTGTVQYDLWKNVLSRVEVRWEHDKDGINTVSNYKNNVLVAANLIYKF